MVASGVPIECKDWSLDSEIQDLQSFDIGVMPLFNDDMAKGKCAFKIIQYMAVGIPTVASRFGMNKGVIEDGKDGFLVTEISEWIERLSLLINDKGLRENMGRNARQKAEKIYSVQANKDKFIEILRGSVR